MPRPSRVGARRAPRGHTCPMATDPVLALDAVRTLAHDSPAGGEWWTVWHADPELLLPVALGAFLYLRGLRRWRERSRSHPRWRVAFYFAGLAAIVLASESPLDYLGERHFTFHMLQHEALMMLAIPMVLLGAPTTPVLLGMPRWARRNVVQPLMRSTTARFAYRTLTHPLVAGAIINVVLWSWHLAPGWYDQALRDPLTHDVQHFSFAASATLMWWSVIDPRPLLGRMGYPLRMLYLLAVSTPKHFLAALITFAGAPLYDVYATVEPVFDLSPERDQTIAGTIMWMPSQMMYLLAMAAVFFVWAHKSEQQQRAIEARQDAERQDAGGLPAGESASGVR